MGNQRWLSYDLDRVRSVFWLLTNTNGVARFLGNGHCQHWMQHIFGHMQKAATTRLQTEYYSAKTSIACLTQTT